LIYFCHFHHLVPDFLSETHSIFTFSFLLVCSRAEP
jgi:hypothetical protein